MANNDGLADIKTAGFLGDPKSESGILKLPLFEDRPENMTRRRKKIFEKGRGRKEVDRLLLQLASHRPEKRLGIALLDFRENHQSPQVGPEVKKVFGGHLPDHDDLLCPL